MDTPTLRKLREYLKNTSHEQQIKDWAAVKTHDASDSPSVQEFIASFRHTPAFRQASLLSTSSTSMFQAEFEMKKDATQIAMAA